MRVANRFDSLLGYFAPRQALANMQARAALNEARQVALAYEAASRQKKLSTWSTTHRGPNAEAQGAIVPLRARSRDLVENNAWAAKAVRVISARTVGSGIGAKPRASSPREAKKAGELYREWSENPELCDVHGQLTVAGMQALAMREVAEGGEVLLLRRLSDRSDFPIRTRIQLLQGDHIDTMRNEEKSSAGGPIVQGVEYDLEGRPAAYWLFPTHPGETTWAVTLESQRIDAADVAHIHRIDRVGQVRGIAWGAPVLLRSRDFDDYERAQLVRQKIAGCFSALLHTPFASSTPQSEGLSIAKGTSGGAAETAEGQDVELGQAGEINPGSIKVLPPGYDFKLLNPPGVQGYGEYAAFSLRAIAAGFGTSYEALSGDYSQVNWSSARMGNLAFQDEIATWQHHMLIPRGCRRIWSWFVEDATKLSGQLRQVPTAEWRTKTPPMTEPVKEGKAVRDRVRAGLNSWQDEVRRSGRDPDEVLEELAEDAARAEKLQLNLDSMQLREPVPAKTDS